MGKRKAKGVLKDIEVLEVSVVDRPANARPFLVVKSENEGEGAAMSKEAGVTKDPATVATEPATGNPVSDAGAPAGDGGKVEKTDDVTVADGARSQEPIGGTPSPEDKTNPTDIPISLAQVISTAVADAVGKALREVVDEVRKAAAEKASGEAIAKAAGEREELAKKASALETENAALKETVAKQAATLAAARLNVVGNSEPAGSSEPKKPHRWPANLNEGGSGRS